MKGIVIIILACLCLGISLVGQTWCELGFGTDITNTSMLKDPLTSLCKAYDSLSGKGKELQQTFDNNMSVTAQANGTDVTPEQKTPIVAGRYAYILFVAIALVVASVAIILIGREDAEEKLVLPVKQ